MVGRDAFGGLFSVLTRSEASWLEDYIREESAEVYDYYDGLASMPLKDVIFQLSKENEARIHSMNFANFRETRRDILGDIRAEMIQGKRIQNKLESYAKRHRISYKKVGSNLREEDSLLELIEVNF